MTDAARSVVTPKLGLYRSAPLASRWADGPRREKCLYLALLPSGQFVRTLAPANDFDFGAYVEEVTTGLGRHSGRVSVVAGRHFHHLGEYAVEGDRVHFTAKLRVSGEEFVQRWWMEVVTEQFLVGRGRCTGGTAGARGRMRSGPPLVR